jgi:hypothetical protein
MGCRVGLLRLHRAGLIELPVARNRNGNGRGLVKPPDALPTQQALAGSAGQLGGLRLEPVASKSASRLWNGLIERWHYPGYTPLPGAQLRYLITWDRGVLGALGFGAAAWNVAARDRWIGWERPGWSPRSARMAWIRSSLRNALKRRINSTSSPASAATRSALARSSSRKGAAHRA